MRSGSPKRSRRTLGPTRRTADSVADLSKLAAACPIGCRDKRRVLKTIIALNNDRHALREKKVSYKTMRERAADLWLFFNELWAMSRYATVDPRTLKPRHIIAVFDRWRARRLSAKTLRNRVSSLRTFAFWISKDALIETAEHEGLDLKSLRVSQVATHDKSWRGHGLKVEEVVADAEKLCRHVATSLLQMDAHGLRLRESVEMHPHEDVVPIAEAEFYEERPEGVTHVLRVRGAKGGRPREIPIASERQWAAVRRAQALVAPGEHLGRPGKSLKTNLRWMYAVLTKLGITRKQLGVTSHGLRHQALGDEYERITGEPAPVRGGERVDRRLDQAARRHIAKIAGHYRTQIVSSYCGSPLPVRGQRDSDQAIAETADPVNVDDSAQRNPKRDG
jgi:site-specific recombinase XerC